ncbi:MAG TPA: hypothetical protein VHN14_08405 [Kofleriaceae bacterium]|jgi:hypothetical protein|nr:hypothetical protein [Kofleriaceae bacterium]
MKRWLLLLLLVSHGACFRLSDPIYAMKPLRAAEPHGDEYSLVFLSIQREGGLFARDIDTVYFRRVDPPARGSFVWTTSEFLFRVFDLRSVKDGHFLIQLSPGVWELDRMVSGRTHWLLSDEARVSSRIYITRPGVYDLGTLRLDKPGLFGKYSLAVQGDAGSAERSRQLWDAVKGTPWERLVAAPPRDAP